MLTRILSQIKSIVCVAAFPLPKKIRVQPSFFGSPFCINIICVVYQQFIYILNDIPLHHPARFAYSNFITDKIHRLRCGVSSSQKISGTTLFFREPFLYQYNLCCLFVCSGDHMGSPLQNVAYITFGYRWWHTLGFSLIGRLNFVSGIICATRSYVRDIEIADCRWQSFCDLTESADESRPLQGFAYITFGCRGRRPRRPVRCSSNNAVMLIINSSFRVIFSYREHPLQHRRVLNPSPAELPCYNS